ncbi:MAG TPA: hypothetical protein VF824_07815 [Thermoanaerobaculia bacterium]|jgi:hypothetical protein
MFESLAPDPGEEGLKKAARMFYVVAAFSALGFVLMVVLLATRRGGSILGLAQTAISVVLAIVTARGIEAQRRWARTLGIVLAVLLLLDFPIGTVIGIATLVFINRANKAGLFA